MKLGINSLISIMLIIAVNLSGCSKFAAKQEVNSDSNEIKIEHLKYVGSKISVEEIKERYNEQDEGNIMPLYNVDKDEEFTFDFKSDLTKDDSIGLYDAVTVHTDKECEEKSKIYYYSDIQQNENGSVVKISPMSPVLDTRTDSENYLNDKCNWGSGPMLYLAIHYDMDSNEIKKLDKPIIIPFTVKSDVEVPNAKAVVTADGVYKLKWDPVEGADYYVVYQLTNSSFLTGEYNEKFDGEKDAYSGLTLLEIRKTEKTEFANFAGDEDGISSIEDERGSYVVGQNYCVNSEFYVTAVSKGKESNLSAPCTTWDLSIPYVVEESSDISFKRYEDTSQMPLEINVLNIDGSITKRRVFYEFQWGKDLLGNPRPEYKYQIEGTALTGYVVMDRIANKNKDFPKTVGTLSTIGNSVPKDNINKSPDSSVETIINYQDDEQASGNEKLNLILNQIKNTKAHTGAGNSIEAKTPDGGVYVNAECAEEEWLALNMIAGSNEISIEAFPKLQNPHTLKDIFYKVYYQNPYILGICSFSYDYKNLTLNVEYSYDKKTIQNKQKELESAASKIVKDIIKEKMSDDEKRIAIYNYLENNSSYDMDALEDCKSNDYIKQPANKYEDSFNAYGVIVKKKGVCMSYAEAYKLLADLAGIECKVATGYLNGNLPHAWNMVNIDDEWYQFDSTNNKNTTGIPYFLYGANSEIADKTCFKLDNLFELDESLDKYKSKDDRYEYYTENKLAVNNIKQYEKLLEKEINKDTEKIVVRYLGKDFKEDEFINAVKHVFNKKGLESKLEKITYSYKNGFLVLNI